MIAWWVRSLLRFSPMDRNRRTFPRIPHREPGLLEFDPGRSKGNYKLISRRNERITVVVSSVACEGVRLSRPEPIDGLRPGSRVNIRLYAGEREVTLPGQVAWLVTASGGETHVGVSLWLEAAPAADRQTWARWIVARTEEQRDKQRGGSNPAIVVDRRKRDSA